MASLAFFLQIGQRPVFLIHFSAHRGQAQICPQGINVRVLGLSKQTTHLPNIPTLLVLVLEVVLVWAIVDDDVSVRAWSISNNIEVALRIRRFSVFLSEYDSNDNEVSYNTFSNFLAIANNTFSVELPPSFFFNIL